MSVQDYSVIGTRPVRHDGVDKVTGRALYAADFQIAGLLHGYVLRSPHAHARIIRIDTSKAAAAPGVHAVVTASKKPDQVVSALKANATRALREAGVWTSDLSPWEFRGSKKYLWDEKQLTDAIAYVETGQGEPLD